MMNIVISGANGRMGKAVAALAKKNQNIKIAAGFDINTEAYDHFKIYDNPFNCDVISDVIIDFSNPVALHSVLRYATLHSIPVVVATTGLSEEHGALIREAAEKIPVFTSANMSLGVNLLIELVKKASIALSEDFDIEIVEKHHNQKLDAPSGTALAIADAISSVVPDSPEYIYDRHCFRRKRNKNEIGIHSVRGGTIVGEHDVIFAGTDEIIEIKHSATSREIFAAGALRAAKFIVDKPPRIYNMTDLFSEN